VEALQTIIGSTCGLHTEEAVTCGARRAVLLGLALIIGVVTACVSAGLPALLPVLFTPDRSLWPLMRMVAPQVRSTLPHDQRADVWVLGRHDLVC